MTEKDFLRQQLQLLAKAHYDAVQPIIKRLAAIEALTTKPLYVWSARDGLQRVEEGVKEPKAESAWTARPDCACFPGTCREQVDKDGVTVSGKRCKAAKPAEKMCDCTPPMPGMMVSCTGAHLDGAKRLPNGGLCKASCTPLKPAR